MQKTVLSTADVARLFNVTETTVKRWCDDGTMKCQKTPGGHRKFELRFLVEFAESTKFEPVGVLAMPDDERLGSAVQVAVLRRDFPVLVQAFIDKSLSHCTTDLGQYLSFLYQQRIPLSDIFDEVVRPALETIGERWSRGEIGIPHEHRASYQTLAALAHLRGEIFTKPPGGNSAVCACIDQEDHEIGLRCASILLEAEGWICHYLGARTPHDALSGAIRDLRPNLVVLSMTRRQPASPTTEHLEEVAAAAHSVGATMVVGGSGAPLGLIGAGKIDAVLSSLRELLVLLDTFEHR